MLRYVLRRFAHAVLVLWATFTATFFLLFILPGDRALAKLGADAGGAGFSAEALAELRRSMGLDQPAIVQYGIALKNAIQGDFGVSAQTGADALQMFVTGIPETLKLAVVACLSARRSASAGHCWRAMCAGRRCATRLPLHPLLASPRRPSG